MSRAPGLPFGWTTAKLEDLFLTITDGDHQPPPQSPTGVPFVVIGDIRNGSINLSGARFVKTAYYDSLPHQKKPARGDLLYTVTGSFGIPVIVGSDDHFCVQRHIAILKPAKAANVRYIRLALSTNAALQQATALATGTAQKTVGLARLRSMTVPLAPTEQQRRIVDALDSLLSRLDAAVASLERAQAKLRAYRASVLKAAVEGRLVPTEAELARKKGRSYEPADALLQRILKERRRRWEQSELANMKVAGKAPENDRWKAKYEEPVPPDTSKLPGLSEGWCWSTLDQLIVEPLANGKSVPDGPGFSVLRLTAIKAGRVDLDQRKTGNWADVDPRGFVLKSGDLLIVRGNGSIRLVGRAGLVTKDADDVAYPDTLIRARVDSNALLHELLAYLWDAPPVRTHLEARAKTTAGIHKVNQVDLAETPVPLPPLAEQARILEEIDRLLSVSNATSEQVEYGSVRTKRLRQAVLGSAFEGKLVDQDTTDEPADVLLGRIHAERSAITPARTKAKRSRKLKAAS